MTERKTSILAIRISPSLKEGLKEEAKKRGKTLTDFIWDLLRIGAQKTLEEANVKQRKENV
jgi:uncharacterized protein (DUF1778 family)